jgi:hypothetical protein
VSIEYLTEFKAARGCSYYDESNTRHRLVAKYAWAVPNEEALETIAKYGPIVEIGAGNGYWAFLLRSMGVEVKAFDLQTNLNTNKYFKPNRDRDEPRHWTKVEQGGSEKAQEYSDHALFLCWPPYNDDMAINTLKAYSGDTLIYVGEDSYGCTANKAFFEYLAKGWERIELVSIPTWSLAGDFLTVYRRK